MRPEFKALVCFAVALAAGRAYSQPAFNPDVLGSFAQMLAYALVPLAFAALILGGVWTYQYLHRKKLQSGKPVLLVHKAPMVWAVATLALGLGLALVVGNTARNNTYREAHLRFMQQMDRSESSIQQEVSGLIKPLNGVRGAFVASESVSRKEFEAMIEALDLRRNYPGVRGIGYAERVKSTELKAFLANQVPVDGQATKLTFLSAMQHVGADEHFPVKFIEPLYPNRAELGIDLASDPLRREAMLAAMQSGEPAMTPKTTLRLDSLNRPGFFVFVPVYRKGQMPPTVDERNSELRGWAFTPVLWAELMSYGSAFDSKLADIQIFDGADIATAELLYDSQFPSGEIPSGSNPRGTRPNLFTAERPVLLLDQVVYLRVSSGPDFEATIDTRAHLVFAAGGSLLSVLAALVVWLLMAGRSRAEALARSMTEDLDRLAMVAQRTTNAVIITDIQQRITWVNEGFERITGYTLEESRGRVPGHFLQSDKTDRAVAKAIAEDMRALRVGRHVILNRRKDGQHYWLQLEVQPLFDKSGSVSGFMAMQQDVSAEVEARHALAREKERADNILEGTGVGTWEINLVTKESTWSDRWGSMLGYTRADIVPSAAVLWRKLLHPEDKPRLEIAFRQCQTGEADGYACEVRARHKDGGWVWILSRAKVMSRLPDGHVEWMGGIHTDITDSKRAEISLRDAEAFLDRAGRIAGVGAWQINLKSGEIIWSDQTCAIYGVPAGHRPGIEEMLAFYQPSARDVLQTALARATDSGKSWDLTSEMTNTRGQARWVRSFGEVEFGDGGPVRLVGAIQDITEDLQTQKEVQRSGELLRGAIDAINEAFVVYDPQDRLVFCNDKYRVLYSKSADFMVVGATFESILRAGLARGQYPEAVGREDAWLVERMAIHRHGDTTLEQRLDDGRWIKVVERKMPDGHIVGFRVDITSLKEATAQAESVGQSLAIQQARLQSILEGTNVGTWEWNVQTGAVSFNARWAEIAGYTLEELAPIDINTWIQLSHPDDLLLSNERLMAHFEARSEFYECEVRMRHKNGHWVWVLDRGRVATRTDDGKPLTMSGTHMEVTERKLAEQALADTTAMLQNVLDSAVDVGIVSTGTDRVLRVFNKGAENLLGYRAQDVVGIKTSSILFDLTEVSALRESLELQLGRVPTVQEVFDHVAGIREPQEWTFVRKDGERFKASLIISPMLDSTGSLVGHLAIIYDISKQKEFETSLRNAMLLAEQSNVAKSQFLANMSHEIRTPMNAILGMLQLLHTTTLDSRQDDYVEKANGAARSLLGLLNDILDFSKVEAGKMQLAPEVFKLETLLADLSVILASNLGEKNVDLLFELDPAIPDELIGDAMRLKQVLINLGGNAVKFTEQGHVAIRWDVLARTPDRIKLQISVRDTGIGIALENQARIFEAFTQAEANTTRRFGGTGLGLVISTRLIQLMGGELALTSTLGQGSNFSFSLELPLPLPLLELGAAAAPLPLAETVPKRVLLVDDNPVVLDSSVAMARSLGWDVAQAGSGEEAMRMLYERLASDLPAWDAVFVDARMPGQSGLDTVRYMRQTYGDRPLPSFILLGFHSRNRGGTRAESDPAWVDGTLVKPLTAKMLAEALAMAQNQALPSRNRAGGQSRQLLAGMQILLVEDNAINQQVASELLKTQGALVTVADNGLIGVNAVKSAMPLFDAVLMDLQMPVMDGLTAARLLRRDPRFKMLPIIAMTANAMATDREACLLAGMNDHVGKPFDVTDLVKTLVRHTGWSPVLQDAARADTAPAQAGVAVYAGAASSWPDGLEIDSALMRMGGNRGLLQRSMIAFVRDAQAMCQRVTDLLARKERVNAKRELHSLKGLAATLGVRQLSRIAARAEKAVDDVFAAPPLDLLLQDLKKELGRVLPALQEVVERLGRAPGAPDQVPSSDADPSALADGLSQSAALGQLEELLRALRDSDMVAMDMHAAMRQHAGPTLAQLMEPLDAAMADLEFERAAVECERLLATVSLLQTYKFVETDEPL